MNGKIVYISLDAVLTGKRIHHVMTEKGYSVKNIQNMMDLSCPQPVYKWIHGQTLPCVDNLYRLSRLFDMHMEDLLVERKTESGKRQASIRSKEGVSFEENK